ncbi:complement factor H-related protein 2-like isoform X2 [Candoia aspera]|uniref:complement factor H-related protein 2-like isoform X2 n=1 Tax=Candoia aspera TaxID=51853 RepID=UPI002FD86DBC
MKQDCLLCLVSFLLWICSCSPNDLGGTCGRPPSVDNGDILEIAKVQYFSGELVTYQCQSYHRMEGSPRVTCQNGHWTEKPSCRVPCTANEEDLKRHNISLRWKSDVKIYSEDGSTVEFVCKRGYGPHPNSKPFRVTCINGKMDYPHCINATASCRHCLRSCLSVSHSG